ncbi:hypothetical protein SPBR_08643 [Sporothrix brasiliensis 5110]|uniref:Uncharacterized protein n=1 Tax=Sporothrix brasiliensis 5110 TaxID=1398154 RepID=A0A0C2EL73_9PEZI|nr:uncharacterized protein SPBR_08643 [Sporothrix brasiliensis 5110]KIH86834.1 hypothetical protein SPBR_08643 [Sporothrix brasiliensis 5110]
MTRVTAPISKLTRSLGSHPSVARPAYIAATSSHQTNASTGAGRTEPAERDDNSRHFTMTHRPTPSPMPSRNRVVPLMQSFNFRTTAPRDARLDVSTIDYAVMPSLGAEAEREAAAAASRMALRVPLLPDNYSPDRTALNGHAPEVADGPLAQPEIVVVAAHPENVVAASALTEIEGMGVDGVELKFAHLGAEASGGSSSSDSEASGGMIRDLWKGLLDDLSGSPAVPKAA